MATLGVPSADSSRYFGRRASSGGDFARTQPFDQSSHRPDQGKEQQGQDQIEHHMEVHQLGGPVDLDQRQPGRHLVEEWQGQKAADQTHQGVAEGHPADGRTFFAGFQQGGQGAAQIGPEDERQAERQAECVLGRQRQDQQDRGDARMGQHGDDGGQGQADQPNSVEVVQHLTQLRSVAQRFRSDVEQGQRKQHQSEADEDARQMVPTAFAGAEQNHADENRQGRQRADVEGEEFGHQARPDIGSQHDRLRRRAVHQTATDEGGRHQAGGRAALQGDGNRQSGQQRQEAVAGAEIDPSPQLSAEGPGNTGAHHAQGPQQESGRAEYIHQYDCLVHSRPSQGKHPGRDPAPHRFAGR